MASLVYCDGFEHQVVAAATPPGYGNGNQKLWNQGNNFNNVTASTGRRASTFAYHLVETGAVAVNVGKTWVGATEISGGAAASAAARTCVVSFYVKIAAAPGVTSSIFMAFLATGGNTFLGMDATGHFVAQRLGGGSQATAGTYADGAWHRIDVRIDTTANPWLVAWSVDGVAQTTLSEAVAAEDIASIRFGSSQTGHNLTFDVDDWVVSATSADYPLGEYAVKALVPTGDGTHVAGTNIIEANGGADIGVVTAFDLVDEWPPNTTDWVQQVAIGATNYAEVTFADPDAADTIALVQGLAAVFSASTAANNLTMRIVDSGGATLADIFSGDVSDTTLRYQSTKVALNPTNAALAGYKGRIGFSSDASPVPQCSALMLQYATPVIAAAAGPPAKPVVVGASIGTAVR